MTVNLSALAGAGQQFFGNDGTPLSGGKLWSYQAGTTTPQTTYTSVAGNVAHTNPIILDSAGRVSTGEIWVTAGQNYKFVLMTSADITIATWDNVTGINGTGIATNADNVQYDPPFLGGVSATAEAKFAQTVSFKDFGAVGDGVTDDRAAIQAAIDAVGGLGGGVIDGSGLTYCVDSANGCVVNYDNVLLQNFTFKRTNPANTGYTLRFATTTNTSGGGVINARFIGIPTVAAMAGLLMGSATLKANNYILENVESIQHGQYGVAIEAGDNWKISNIRVREHGLTTGSISSCMGFYVYPKIASSGGQLNNVSSQISDACVANTSANTAAIKLQTHQRLTATNIRAVYGSESCMVVDSVDGIISNIFVRQQASDAGLVIGNRNTAHSFSGQKFTINGFIVEGSGSAPNNEFLIGGGDNGQYKLTGCIVRNGRAGGAGFLNYSNTKDCVFENLSFGDMRFSSAIRGYLVNSAPSTNNIYRNVTVDSTTGSGTIAIETSNSLISNCGGVAKDLDLVGSFIIYGDNNQITNPYIVQGSTNALDIRGDNNEIFNLQATDIAGRSLFFPAGSDNNVCYSGNLFSGTGVSDVGSGNRYFGIDKWFSAETFPTTGTWALGDIVWNTSPTVHEAVGWVCVVAGTPGTWAPFGGMQTGFTYTVTNPVTNRSLNVSTATLADVTQVLGQLIRDLQTGLILK